MKSIFKAACAISITTAFGLFTLVSAPLAFAHADKPHAATKKSISADEHAWGREGDPKRATRSIEIRMTDNMRFAPDKIEVKQGETVKFVVTNNGMVMHEMVIGTKEELAKHAAMMKKHPNMEHDEPYMSHIAAGKKGDMVWHFTKTGTFEFACLIPGHFEAGMRGSIHVSPNK